jgi:PAS domain-containing protein
MCVLVTIADITERKQVEEELRESEMRFSALFDSSPVPVIELDCSIINNRFNELRNLGVKNIREYFDTNPEEVAAFTSLVKVTNVNQTSVVFFGAGSKEGVIAGMPDYFLSQSPTAYKEELIALAEGSVRFENETAVHLVMRGDLTVFHILSVVPGYEQSLERVLVSFIDVTQQAEMYNREHNIANILQRALLPSRIPQIPGCDISVEYHTHKHIQLLKNNY